LQTVIYHPETKRKGEPLHRKFNALCNIKSKTEDRRPHPIAERAKSISVQIYQGSESNSAEDDEFLDEFFNEGTSELMRRWRWKLK
jgi:hypothetical protein